MSNLQFLIAVSAAVSIACLFASFWINDEGGRHMIQTHEKPLLPPAAALPRPVSWSPLCPGGSKVWAYFSAHPGVLKPKNPLPTSPAVRRPSRA